MSETQPTNLWDFQNHPEWQDILSNNGVAASHERYTPSEVIYIDEAKLSADALRLTNSVLGQHDFDKTA